MRIAFFSPLPPAKSGIADYSAALLELSGVWRRLRRFHKRPVISIQRISRVCLYQARQQPVPHVRVRTCDGASGVIVCTRLISITSLQISPSAAANWDAYMREVEMTAARKLWRTPRNTCVRSSADRITTFQCCARSSSAARGVIVHSRATLEEVRAQGYTGPAAVIPHGAWIPSGAGTVEADRMAYRARLVWMSARRWWESSVSQGLTSPHRGIDGGRSALS